MLAHFYLLKSTVYTRVHSQCCTFHGFAKCIMPCIRHYSITQNNFAAPDISCAPSIFVPSSLPPTPGNHCSVYSLHSFIFPKMSYSWNHITCSLFRLSFSLLVICIYDSSRSFCDLIAHFFLSLNNISLYGCTTQKI